MKNYDVVIIGTGFAGITVARELSQHGYTVALLEARDRIGGRAWSQSWYHYHIEMGGGWIYWTQPHVWAEINRYQIPIIERLGWPKNLDSLSYVRVNEQTKKIPSAENFACLMSLAKEMEAEAKQLYPQPYNPAISMDTIGQYDHLSSQDKLDQMTLTATEQVLLNRLFSIQCHNHPSQGGYVEFLRWLALAGCNLETYFSSVSRFQFANGTKHLLQAMLDDCQQADVYFNRQITKVTQKNGQVTVEDCKGNQVTSQLAVSTVPVNVLKNIKFMPSLTQQKSELSQQELSGKGKKIYVRIQGCWPNLNGSATATDSITTVMVHQFGAQETVIIVFTMNDQLSSINKQTLEQELRKFEPKINVLDYTFHNWTDDPLALGTWGNFRPKQVSQYLQKAQQNEGNLYFAGSDLANGWRGFFDGAIESGLRTARNIQNSKKFA